MLKLHPIKKSTGPLGPKQLKWCDEKFKHFKEYREGVEQVKALEDQSKAKAA